MCRILKTGFCHTFSRIFKLPKVNMLAVVSTEISKIFDQIINKIVVSWPEQVSNFHFETKFALILIKEPSVQTDKIV